MLAFGSRLRDVDCYAAVSIYCLSLLLTRLPAPTATALWPLTGPVFHCVLYLFTMVTLTLATDEILALQALIYTADMRDAANQCTEYSYESLRTLCGNALKSIDSSLAVSNS